MNDAGVFRIKNRLSFQHFLGRKLYVMVLDAETIYTFGKTLKPKQGTNGVSVKEVFDLFYEKLDQKGLILNE